MINVTLKKRASSLLTQVTMYGFERCIEWSLHIKVRSGVVPVFEALLRLSSCDELDP